MIVQCPNCGKRYRFNEQDAEGRDLHLKCSSCQQVFPALPEGTAEATPDSPPPSSSAAGPSQKRILVCDDTPFFRNMLEDILTEAGFIVQAVGTGEEAIEKVSAEPPDLLLLDLQLPGISGFEVVAVIRRDLHSTAFPILAMSAVFTDSSDVMSLEDAGADDYIGKDFKPEHLVGRVRRMLGLATE